MKERFMRFMYGRYGIDSLGKCILGIGIAAAVISWFTTARIFPVLSWACLIYMYFRMFSRNVYKRSAENRVYMEKTYKLRCFFCASEKYARPAQDTPHLQMPLLPAENPHSPGKRTY